MSEGPPMIVRMLRPFAAACVFITWAPIVLAWLIWQERRRL